MQVKIKSIRHIKKENWNKLNQILRFYNGFDNLIEYTYSKLQKALQNTLENSNDIMNKPMYIIPIQ